MGVDSASPPCVLSSTVCYAQCPTIQWKAYVASDGAVSASLHRQLLPTLAVETAVTAKTGEGGGAQAGRGGGGGARSAVGVAITLG